MSNSGLYGAIYFGAIPVALYPPTRMGFLKSWQEQTVKMLMEVDAKLVITKKALFGLLKQTLQKANCRAKLVCIEDLMSLEPCSSSEFRASTEKGGDGPCVIQFSSGTTGKPKPTYISHNNIIHNVGAISGLLTLDWPIGVSWLPLYHDMGLFGTLFLSLLSPRGTLHLMRPEQFISKPLLWLQVLSKRRIARLSAEEKLSSLRRATLDNL